MSRLCIVEDDDRLITFLDRALRDGGYEVDLAHTGGQGLERVDARPYAMVLLDLGLPDMEGLDVLNLVRERHPEVRIIVISGRADPATRVRCLDGGACDFVAKPFDLPELLARVRAQLRTPGQSLPAPRLAVGEATLDLVRHCLAFPDRTVGLAPREFLLVKHLMSRPGQVCTREELLRAVWRNEFHADSNVVDVYVSRLRAKIPSHCIETVRHVGYCFASF